MHVEWKPTAIRYSIIQHTVLKWYINPQSEFIWHNKNLYKSGYDVKVTISSHMYALLAII